MTNKFKPVLQEGIDKRNEKMEKKLKKYEGKEHTDNIFIVAFKNMLELLHSCINVLTIIAIIIILCIIAVYVASMFNPNIWYFVNEKIQVVKDAVKLVYTTIREDYF